jgi:hypothetical protein
VLAAALALIGVVPSAAAAAPVQQAPAPAPPPPLDEYAGPPLVDATNQAGWWTPLVEHDGALYYAYDGPGSSGGTHVVLVAKRLLTTGEVVTSCLAAGGGCIQFGDDVGHNQPSVAVDGDGFVHVFTAMHSSPWRQHYFRSAEPESVTTMVDRGATLPDQSWTHTYPVPATAPDGSVWLAIRSRSSAGAAGVGGRLYHYDPATQTWTRTATFAYNPGLWVYPDDLQIDSSGRLHIAYEWVKKYVNWFPHIGAYAIYVPSTGRFVNAGGQTMTAPLTVNSPAVYQSWSSSFDPTARYNGLGVQTAKLALDPVTHRPQIAYRYTPRYGQHLAVLLTRWDGHAWRRTTVYAGRYDTFPTVDLTLVGSSLRIYYTKVNTTGGPSAFVAWPLAGGGGGAGGFGEASLAGSHPGIERLSAIPLSDGRDALYLSAPHDRPPGGSLYLGVLPR